LDGYDVLSLGYPDYEETKSSSKLGSGAQNKAALDRYREEVSTEVASVAPGGIPRRGGWKRKEP
jgi:hypothetical protein